MTTKGKPITKIEVKQTDFRKVQEANNVFRSPQGVMVSEGGGHCSYSDITFLQVPQVNPLTI
jgi:hypothetical protein